ncbi:hypothetical protein HDU76_011621 [Blyttiomyces sp. JEL0837]|nr:hypothetical protein HDU76_011621 [Blyttiomyces sp. JEL0837]
MSSCRVSETRVLPKTIDAVWKQVRPTTLGFSKIVSKVEVEGSVDAVGSIRKVTFKDGTVQKYRIVELSAIHTIRLRKVSHDNSTFVEFVSEFASGEMTAAVVEDSKYKKKEYFEDLLKSL